MLNHIGIKFEITNVFIIITKKTKWAFHIFLVDADIIQRISDVICWIKIFPKHIYHHDTNKLSLYINVIREKMRESLKHVSFAGWFAQNKHFYIKKITCKWNKIMGWIIFMLEVPNAKIFEFLFFAFILKVYSFKFYGKQWKHENNPWFFVIRYIFDRCCAKRYKNDHSDSVICSI